MASSYQTLGTKKATSTKHLGCHHILPLMYTLLRGYREYWSNGGSLLRLHGNKLNWQRSWEHLYSATLLLPLPLTLPDLQSDHIANTWRGKYLISTGNICIYKSTVKSAPGSTSQPKELNLKTMSDLPIIVVKEMSKKVQIYNIGI